MITLTTTPSSRRWTGRALRLLFLALLVSFAVVWVLYLQPHYVYHSDGKLPPVALPKGEGIHVTVGRVSRVWTDGVTLALVHLEDGSQAIVNRNSSFHYLREPTEGADSTVVRYRAVLVGEGYVRVTNRNVYTFFHNSNKPLDVVRMDCCRYSPPRHTAEIDLPLSGSPTVRVSMGRRVR